VKSAIWDYGGSVDVSAEYLTFRVELSRLLRAARPDVSLGVSKGTIQGLIAVESIAEACEWRFILSNHIPDNLRPGPKEHSWKNILDGHQEQTVQFCARVVLQFNPEFLLPYVANKVDKCRRENRHSMALHCELDVLFEMNGGLLNQRVWADVAKM